MNRPLTFSLERLLSPRGEVKFTTLLFLAAVVGGGFFVAVYGPLYIDNYSAGEKCREAVNETWRNRDEENTRQMFLKKVRRVALVDALVDGAVQQVPAINPNERDVIVELNEVAEPPYLRLTYDYSRIGRFPVINKEREFFFRVECEESLDEVQW